MEWLTWIFLESLAALGALLGTVLFVLLVYWRRSTRVLPLLIGLGLAGVLLVVQSAVTTRREHAAEILAAVETDIVDGHAAALAVALAADFSAGPRDREAFIEYVRRRLRQIDVRWLDRQRLDLVASSEGEFAVSVGYLAGVMGEYGGTVPSSWRITFVYAADGWRIGAIECERLGWQDIGNWAELDRY